MKTRRDVTRLLALGGTSLITISAGCTGLAEDLGLVERELNQGTAPQAGFKIEYDSEAGQVTVAMEGGAEISASNLYIRGAGLEQTGSWASLSDNIEPDSEVTAGSTVSVGVRSDFEVRVVWDDGDTQRTYEEATGPDS